MTTSKIDSWIQAGYTILATEGIDGIKIERVARALGLNKSGFYYYFGTLESYVKSLIQHHIHIAKDIAIEIEACQHVDPDFLYLIIRHKAFFLVESRLLVKNRLLQVDNTAEMAGVIINNALIHLLRKNTDLPESSILTYLNIFRHFFYARIEPENITYDFFHTLTGQIKDLFSKAEMDKTITAPQNIAGEQSLG
jgi:AcrR family transcriptional regulator